MFDKLEELRVYQQAMEISDVVWKEVIKWSVFEKDTVGKQLMRAADSVGSNIAEGYGRYSYKEFIHHLYIARGSLFETIHWTKTAQRRNLLKDVNLVLDKTNALLPQLQAYINSRKRIKESV